MLFKNLWNTAFGPLDDYDGLADRYFAWMLLIIFTVVAIFFSWLLLGLFLYHPVAFFIVMLILGGIIAPPIIAHLRHKKK